MPERDGGGLRGMEGTEEGWRRPDRNRGGLIETKKSRERWRIQERDGGDRRMEGA